MEHGLGMGEMVSGGGEIVLGQYGDHDEQDGDHPLEQLLVRQLQLVRRLHPVGQVHPTHHTEKIARCRYCWCGMAASIQLNPTSSYRYANCHYPKYANMPLGPLSPPGLHEEGSVGEAEAHVPRWMQCIMR
jgi:hypothetical protein